MTIADLSAINEVQCDAYGADFLEPMVKFEHILNEYADCSYVALWEEQVVGYVVAYPSDAGRHDYDQRKYVFTGNEDSLYVHDLCLHSLARGMGMAKLLFSAVLDHVSESGYQNLIGVAVQDSVPFWQKLGFEMKYEHSYNGEPGQYMERA